MNELMQREKAPALALGLALPHLLAGESSFLLAVQVGRSAQDHTDASVGAALTRRRAAVSPPLPFVSMQLSRTKPVSRCTECMHAKMSQVLVWLSVRRASYT